MKQRRVIRPKPCLRCPGILLLAILTSGIALAEDSGYPPPPGPYRSEPVVLPGLADSPNPDVPRKDDGQGGIGTNHGSRLLPLPADVYTGRTDSYGASNLFGSAAPVQPATAPGDEPSFRSTAEEQEPTHFGTPTYPTATGRQPGDFSVDFSDNGRQPQGIPRYQGPDGRFDTGAPPYPAAPSGYPQAGGGYYPGQGMNYPQTPAGSPYQDYYAAPYAPAYPQAGVNAPPQRYYPAAGPAVPGYANDSYRIPDPQQGYETAGGLLTNPTVTSDALLDSAAFPAGGPQPAAPSGGAIFRPAD